MFANFLNSLGLVLDIAGAILLWKFGLPASIDRHGRTYRITSEIDEGEKAKGQLYDHLGKAGLGLLVIGFVLQLVSNYISP